MDADILWHTYRPLKQTYHILPLRFKVETVILLVEIQSGEFNRSEDEWHWDLGSDCLLEAGLSLQIKDFFWLVAFIVVKCNLFVIVFVLLSFLFIIFGLGFLCCFKGLQFFLLSILLECMTSLLQLILLFFEFRVTITIKLAELAN